MEPSQLESAWRELLSHAPPGSDQETPRLPPGALSSFRPLSWYPPDRDAELAGWVARQTSPEAQDLHLEDRFALEELLGRGGMGAVFRARQASLGRDVAVKKLLPGKGHSRTDSLALFVAEAQLTGRLEHPNIVPVYALSPGEAGETFLAMKRVEGQAWRELIHDRTVPLERHLAILLQVCHAIAFAHSRSIIHNDLKPANVMLGAYGEVLVVDWGLAVSFGEQTAGLRHCTAIDGPCGTPAYMPPELAEGNGAAVGPPTDVYLLGGLLYEILHRRPPHAGKKILDLVVRAAQGHTPPLDPELPVELRKICTRALACAPRDRYPDGAAFRDALSTYITHRESAELARATRRRLAACRAESRAATGLSATQRSDLYERFAACVAGFAQARELWADNADARDGELETRRAYADTAIVCGDLGLAATQAGRVRAEGADATALEDRIATRRRADAAREASRRRLRRGLVGALTALVVVLGSGVAGLVWHNRVILNAKEVSDRRGELAVDAFLQLSGTLQGHLQDEIADEASQAMARDFLAVAQEGWEALRATDFAGEGAELGLALSHLAAGDLALHIDGDLAKAIREYSAAVGVLSSPSLQGRSSGELLLRARYSLGYTYRRAGRFGEGLAEVRAYLTLLARLEREQTGLHARGLRLLGSVLAESSDLEDALDAFRAAERVERALPADNASPGRFINIANSVIQQARVESVLGQADSAQAHLEEARELTARVLRARPSGAVAISQIAVIDCELAVLHLAAGRNDSAVVVSREAVLALRELYDRSPRSSIARAELSFGLRCQVSAYIGSGNLPEAAAVLAEAIPLVREQVSNSPHSYESHYGLAQVLIKAATLAEALGDESEARTRYGEARRAIDDARRLGPSVPRVRRLHRLVVAMGASLPGDSSSVEKLRAAVTDARAENTMNSSRVLDLGDLLHRLATAELRDGQLEAAKQTFAAAHALHTEHEEMLPGALYGKRLAIGTLGLARCAMREDAERVVGLARTADSTIARVLTEHPGDLEAHELRHKIRTVLARAELASLSPEAARRVAAQNLAALEDFTERRRSIASLALLRDGLLLCHELHEAGPGLNFLQRATAVETERLRSVRRWGDPSPVRLHSLRLQLAVELVALQRHDEAEALLNDSISVLRERQDVDSTGLLARCLVALRDLLAASGRPNEAYRRLVTAWPTELRRPRALLLATATSARRAGEDSVALALFEAGVARFPSELTFAEGLGDMRRVIGDLDGALEAYRALLDEAPLRATTLVRTAVIEALRGEREAALALLQDVLHMDATRPEALVHALLFVALGGDAAALAPFLAPRGWPGSLVLALRGELDDAQCLEDLAAVLVGHPGAEELTSLACAYLGMRAETLGNLERALELYRVCLENAPSTVDSIEALWARDRLRANSELEKGTE